MRGSPPLADRAQHGIRSGVVLASLGVLALVIAGVAVIMHVLSVHWRADPAGANAPLDARIEAPVLESAPQYDASRYFAAKEGVLASYGWIDREKGVARIPIETAMRIMAGERVEASSPELPKGAPRSEQSRTPGDANATAGVEQRPGARLPLDTTFLDESGSARQLAAYFGATPVVLVFGYYRCPTLCTTMMESVLTSLAATQLAQSAYAVVGLSIDPREGPPDALRKARAYRAAYEGLPLSLLTGTREASTRIAKAAGVSYAYDSAVDQYAHPLALMVVAPDGRISRYFGGVRFEPRELRLALVEAAQGRIGTLTERIFLKCAHFDPATGRYTIAALWFVRGGVLLTLAALAAIVWRRRSRRARVS